MKEADFQKWVTDTATACGWRWWHVPAPMQASRTGDWVPARHAAGLPDLILLSEDPPRMIIAELKGDGGRLSDAQQEFLRLARDVARTIHDEANMLTSAYQQRLLAVYAWYPADMPKIESILKNRVLL